MQEIKDIQQVFTYIKNKYKIADRSFEFYSNENSEDNKKTMEIIKQKFFELFILVNGPHMVTQVKDMFHSPVEVFEFLNKASNELNELERERKLTLLKVLESILAFMAASGYQENYFSDIKLPVTRETIIQIMPRFDGSLGIYVLPIKDCIDYFLVKIAGVINHPIADIGLGIRNHVTSMLICYLYWCGSGENFSDFLSELQDLKSDQ